jgi:plastocyanin
MNKGLIIGLLVLVLAVGGYFVYGGTAKKPSTAQPAAPAPQAGASIEINNFKFNPNRLTVKASAVVTVTNKEVAGHTVTSDTSGLFDTGLIGKDGTKTFAAPDKAGEYPFHCGAHPSMTGVLVVE